MKRNFLLAYQVTGKGAAKLRKSLLEPTDTNDVTSTFQVEGIDTTITGKMKLDANQVNDYNKADELIKEFFEANYKKSDAEASAEAEVEYVFIVSEIIKEPKLGKLKLKLTPNTSLSSFKKLKL